MARAAKIDGMTVVTGVWDEVYTGLEDPKTVTKGQKVSLPSDIARILIVAKAVKNV